jgi:probable HAF family extracellular repeat protein
MKSRLQCFATVTLFAALAIPVRLAAQEQQQNKQQLRYKLVDFGTFGGPSSYLEIDNGVNGAPSQVVNNAGTVAGWGDTSTPDPYSPNCFQPYAQDCFLTHAFQWQKGVLTDLGVLLGGDASTAAWVSDTGLIAGQSRNGSVDPLIRGFGETRAVLWQGGKIINLGTLGGNESSAFSVNNRGQVVGVAVNTIPDPFSFLATQLRAFLWENGAMQDLGTLGGPEGWALFINERGQVAGFSLTNFTPNPTTGFPTQNPFLWEQGTMLDLGTLGGTVGAPNGLNNRGQVVGASNLAGDVTFHPFLWTKTGGLQDLGTFGGNFGAANAINEAGDVVGFATNTDDQAVFAFLWRNGVLTDLGALNGDDCSVARYINSSRQIVGASFSCAGGPSNASLWQNGGHGINLNTFVPPGSDLTLTDADFINNRGEIAGAGVLPNGDTHAFLLIPCEGDDDGCQSENPTGAAHNSPALSGHGMLDLLRARRFPGHRIPGVARAPTN